MVRDISDVVLYLLELNSENKSDNETSYMDTSIYNLLLIVVQADSW